MNIGKLSSILPEDNTSLSFQVRQIIFHSIKDVLGDETGEKMQFSDIQIEHPKNIDYRDYSINVAMILAGRLKVKPAELVEKLAEKINSYIRQHQLIILLSDSKLTQGIIIFQKISWRMYLLSELPITRI